MQKHLEKTLSQKAKRRLLFVSLSTFDTLSNSLHNDILQMLSNRFTVEVLCVGSRNTVVSKNIFFHSLPIYLWPFSFLSRLFSRKKYDLVYINDFFVGGLFGTLFSFFSRSKLVFRCGSAWKYPMTSFLDYVKNAILFFTRPIVLWSCDKIVYNSQSIVQSWPKHLYSVVYNFVDSDHFLLKDRYFQGNSNLLHILYVGRLRYEKGVTFLCDAVSSLEEKVHLTVVGDGPLRKELGHQYSHVSNISFLGRMPHNQLVNVMHKHDVLILPSLWQSSESFPNVIVEAMSTGLAVVGTNVWGMPELIDSGKNGLLIEPGSSESILKVLRHFIENPKDVKRMGKSGREKVLREYRKDVQLQKLYNAFFS